MNDLNTIDLRTGRPFTGLQKARPHGSLDGESIDGNGLVTGRARGLLGGAFMGVMLAQQGGKAWTNPYVTDGLIAMWDGEWNAGGGVHDANATIWKDLAAAGTLGDISLANRADGEMSWTSNAYVFGSAHTVFSKKHETSWYTQHMHGFAVEVVGAFTRGSYTLGIINYTRNNYVDLYWQNFRLGQANTLDGVGTSAGPMYIAASAGRNHVSLTHSVDVDNQHTIFRVNNTTKSKEAAAMQGTGQQSYALQFSLGGSSIQSGDYIQSLRVYSRALTSTEIAANYAVDAARFGLT